MSLCSTVFRSLRGIFSRVCRLVRFYSSIHVLFLLTLIPIPFFFVFYNFFLFKKQSFSTGCVSAFYYRSQIICFQSIHKRKTLFSASSIEYLFFQINSLSFFFEMFSFNTEKRNSCQAV